MSSFNIKPKSNAVLKSSASQTFSVYYPGVLFLLISQFCTQHGISQSVSAYIFTATSGTYQSITGISKALSGGNMDDGWFNANPIGFTFILDGTSYTTFNASTNGFITLGGTLTSSIPNNSNSGGLTACIKRPVIAPLWDDIYPGSVTYLTTGASPNRVTTIQWDNVLWDNSNTSGATVSFQIKLFETSDTIMFVYDNLAANYHPGSGGASAGITGTATGANNFLSVDQMSTSATVSYSTETNNISAKPASGLTFTFSPNNNKYWIGSGAGGTGTNFNEAANWNPASIPAAGDNLIMNINNFAANANPFATLSTATTITALTITFSGIGASQQTFNLNTGNKKFTISNKLSLNNTSSGNGGGNLTLAGHTLNFNVGGNTTTIGKIEVNNTGTGNHYLTNITIAPTATLADNGDYTATINNTSGNECRLTLANSGIASITGTTNANAVTDKGRIQFNVDNLPAELRFNGDSYLGDASAGSSYIALGSTSVSGNTTGNIVFKGSIINFGVNARSVDGNTFGHIIFDGTGSQPVIVNSNQLLLPGVVIGQTNSPVVTLGGSANALIGQNSIITGTGLEINNTSVLDLTDRTLNISGASTGILTIPAGGKLRCGGIAGGVGISNFPRNFAGYNLSSGSTVEYYSTQDQTIADITYGKLTLTGSSTTKTTKTVIGTSTIANGVVAITPNKTVLDLNNYIITANKAFSGGGTIKANACNDLNSSSGIIVKSTGTIKFVDTVHNYLKILTINSGGNITLGNPVNILAGAPGDYGTVTVNGTGILNANGYLTLKSSAGDVSARIGYSTGVISGYVTAERFMPPKRAWRFLCVPFSTSLQSIHDAWQEEQTNTNPYACPTNDPAPAGYGTEITNTNALGSGYDYNLTSNPSIKSYEFNMWLYPTSTVSGNSIADKPYCIFIRGDRTICLSQGTAAIPNATVLRAKGVLYQTGGINSFIKTYSGTSGDYIMIGNPYASTIDLTDIINGSRSTNNYGFTLNQFWVWDPVLPGSDGVGAYVTYNNGLWAPSSDNGGSYPSGSGNLPLIQSGQAFMLQTNATNANVQFQEDDKTTSQMNVFGKSLYYNKSTLPVIYTNLIAEDDTSVIDGVAAGFANKFSAAIDANDAKKRWNDGENLSLHRNESELAIELRPLPSYADTLFFRLSLSSKAYALQIFSIDVPANINGWLIDKYLNKEIPVASGDKFLYKFIATADSSSYKNRFMFVLNPDNYSDLSIDQDQIVKPNFQKGSINIYPNPVFNNHFTISLAELQPGKYHLLLFDKQGHILLKEDFDCNGNSEDYKIRTNKNWANGIYDLIISNEDGKVIRSAKIIVNK